MATSSKNVSSLQFDHPTAGRCRVDVSILAVRWRGTSSAEQRRTWLGEAGAELLTAAKDAVAPLAQVNQTDGLSWVRGGVEALRKLESSDAVEWVAPALRPEQTDARSGDPVAPDLAMFTVNPSRFYVRQALVDTAPAEALKAIGVSVDASRPARLRGYATAQVDDASFSAGRSTVHVAASLAKALGVAAAGGGDIRYETIPLLSPAAHAPGEIAAPVRADSRLPACRPPSSEFHPNDPMFAQQWGLQRVGAPRAWEIMRGLPAVTVAVLDEGVELGHPDLNLHPQSWNASSDTPDGGPTGNHGTACAGIVAARMDNAQGVAGIAGGARIMAIATATWADVDIAEGLYFAADNGARVVSMSFGVYASWNFWDFDIVRDALQYAHDRGLLLVAASGNENGPQARFPGSDGRTLCVGGSNRSDERKRIGDASSEAWWGASYGPDVDVVAPCLEMPTTDRFGASGYAAGDYHDRFNGTSSATPLVAGLGALLFSLRPVLSNVEARRIIESTCDKISPSLYAYANVGGKPSGTWNNEVGYGRVNAERALLKACEEGCDCEEAGCSGCGGRCGDDTPEACRGPKPVPWLPFDRCMYFYEARTFGGGNDNSALQRLRLRVTYQHCLRLVGRQQGPLLYTTTLLPGEEVRLFEYDRYRRTRAESQRVSVHASFRQTLSALSQSRRAVSTNAYFDTLNEVRTHADTSVSAGGGLAGFLGAPQVKGEFGADTETTVASGGSVRTASEQFAQLAVTASQALEAERSLTVSTFEEQEHVSTTARSLKNHNGCYAVTYFVRRVNEVYEVSTRIESVEWRLGDATPWRSANDLAGLSDALRKLLAQALKELLKDGQSSRDARVITVPTDGTLYEAELAHCASCEPVRMAEADVRLEQLRLQARRACLETELLELELQRRRAIAQGGSPAALELGVWPLLPAGSAATAEPGH